jgi:hypothetical protein
MDKRVFDLVLIEFLLLTGAMGLVKVWAARTLAEKNKGVGSNVAATVVNTI